MNLFEIATSRSQWLMARQSAIASNVANANTAGYQARDVKSFEELLPQLQANASSGARSEGILDSSGTQASASWEVLRSGNSVVLEQEMLKAGQVQNDYALGAGIVRSFHRMLLSATRG
jgi:flagellar basal-body rod protein FlgB